MITHVPNLMFLLGREILDELPRTWADTISTITEEQPHLLPQNPDALHERAKAGQLFVVADLDHPNGIKIIGFAALWDLGTDKDGRGWREFGTVYVDPSYSFTSHPELRVSFRLYNWMQGARGMALATTTNSHAMGTGEHAGLRCISFDSLPPEIRQKTCTCGPEKTRSSTPDTCELPDTECFLRVSQKTYEGLGYPPLIPLRRKPHPPSSASG